MNKPTLIVAGLVVVLILLFGGIGFLTLSTGPMIHGYDGPVATITEIEHIYPSGINPVVEVTPAHASVYPQTADFLDLAVACGLRMEIQAAPNVINQEVIETLTRSVLDAEAKTNTTITVEVKKVHCDMTVTVSTYNGGLASCFDTTFWIQVEDNAYSIFTNADENLVYVPHIYTRDLPVERGSMEFIPTSSGWTFPPTTVSTHEVPQWVRDSGYQPSGQLFEVVKFPIRILSGVPSYGWFVRTESSVTFDIGFDVILIGEWKQVHQYLEGDWPDPDSEDPMWLIITILLSIVGVAGTVFIVVRLGGRFHPILLLLFVAVCWIPLALWLATDVIGNFLVAFGLGA